MKVRGTRRAPIEAGHRNAEGVPDKRTIEHGNLPLAPQPLQFSIAETADFNFGRPRASRAGPTPMAPRIAGTWAYRHTRRLRAAISCSRHRDLRSSSFCTDRSRDNDQRRRLFAQQPTRSELHRSAVFRLSGWRASPKCVETYSRMASRFAGSAVAPCCHRRGGLPPAVDGQPHRRDDLRRVALPAHLHRHVRRRRPGNALARTPSLPAEARLSELASESRPDQPNRNRRPWSGERSSGWPSWRGNLPVGRSARKG